MRAAPAELFGHPVRRRWLRQLVEYGPSNTRWREALHAGASRGGEDDAAARLRSLLHAAESGTRHYPEAFLRAGVSARDIRSRDELAHLPVLTRRGLQTAYYDLFHRAVDDDAIDEGWLGRSSGSTGEPVRFFMDARSIHFFTAFIRFLWERHRLGPLPRPGRAGIVLLCTLPRSAIYQAWMPLFRFTRFRKLHWAEPRAEETLARLSPAVITGDPDSLAALADACEAGLSIRPRLILSSAFALPAAIAARLRESTGAAVIDYFSMAETGPIAWRCASGRLHVVEGAVEVESIAGEIAVTNLRNPLFPLIRYRTGDLGRVDEARDCACGAWTRALSGFDGRVAGFFLAEDGSRRDPSQLAPVLSALPLTQFALEQRSREEIVLRYHADAPLPAGSTRALEESLSRLLASKPHLTLERRLELLRRPGEKPVVFRSLLSGER